MIIVRLKEKATNRGTYYIGHNQVVTYSSTDNFHRYLKWKFPFVFPLGTTPHEILDDLGIPRTGYRFIRDNGHMHPYAEPITIGGSFSITLRHNGDGSISRWFNRIANNNPIEGIIRNLPRIAEFYLEDGSMVVIDRLRGQVRETIISKKIRMRWVGCDCDPLKDHTCKNDPWKRLMGWRDDHQDRIVNLNKAEKDYVLVVVDEDGQTFIYRYTTTSHKQAKYILAKRVFDPN